ncbi:MAG TPA: long-chain fatty acid--CoA ligase [Polyangiales bacterium]|nr:long-chain fatty acid--CoA ligase [Polyangiales bacterium]
MNITEQLVEAAERAPEQAAIVFEGRTLRYADLNRAASQVAEMIGEWGLAPGDRVALLLPNIPEFAITCLGAQKFGAVVVSLNIMLRSAELAYALRDCGARALFTTEAALREIEPIRSQLPELLHIVVCEGNATAWAESLSELRRGRPGLARPCAREPSDPAAILYTSGTTGNPKGAVLSHGNLLSNAASTQHCVGSRPGDRHLLFLPLSHCFGQNFILHTAIRSLGTVVLERRYELQATLADIQRHEVSHFYGVPTNYIYLLDAGVERAQLSSVRFFFSAAATMPREIAQSWRERFGTPIYEGYGLTETAPLATYNHLHSYRAGSVGTAIPGVELKVVADGGRVCDAGEWGEICIKGPNVMSGYYQREEATREAIRDGWFHSGDIGYRDADGYYYLVDRQKDMINCAGYKVWPREVEEVLYQHAAVAECAVVGFADPIKGERVVAFVRLKPGATPDSADLRGYCEARSARYKVPAEFVFDREIPKSPSGKILKRVLRG